MRRNSKGLNNNLISYLCKLSGTLYVIAIVSSCNNDKRYQNINEKQYMPTGGHNRNRGGSGSANKETLPSKKIPNYKNDELTETENNNWNEVRNNYSSNNNDSDHQDVGFDANNGDMSRETSSKEDEEKSNYSDIDKGKCIFSLDKESKIQLVYVDETCKDFSKMQSVCPKCGILLDYGENGNHHKDFPDDHLLISIKEAADYVYEADFGVFMKNLDLYEKFIEQQKNILEKKKEKDNFEYFFKNNLKSIDQSIKDCEKQLKKEYLKYKINQFLENNLKSIDQSIECFDESIKNCNKQFKSVYQSIENYSEFLKNYKEQLKCVNQSIENYKQQLKYIKVAKNLKERFDENPDSFLDGDKGTTIKTILKAFAFTILKYTSQLKGIEMNLKPLDSGNNYQMFYGARYLDNVEMAMIFGLRGRESDKKRGDDHIPISISRAFDSKINFPFHGSGTIGGSADGYVAIFDNHRKKQLYITNILTGESVTVLDVKNWMQPIFWKKKLLLFSTWDDSMLMFDRDEFMRNPNLSLGIKIPKERLLNLPDSFETHHTGKFFFSNINILNIDRTTIKEFDIESETITKEIKTDEPFSSVPLFGIEKLPAADQKKSQDIENLIYLSTPTGLFKQEPTGEYKEILKTNEKVSSMILSNKNPEDYSKALIFGWSKIYYENKSSRRLCNIPIKPINMVMRLYSDVYYVMNAESQKWECRRIFFDEDFEDQ